MNETRSSGPPFFRSGRAGVTLLLCRDEHGPVHLMMMKNTTRTGNQFDRCRDRQYVLLFFSSSVRCREGRDAALTGI